MKLTNKQIRYLKGEAHAKKPVVTVGIKGLSKAVHEEIDGALSAHELIKVKLPAGPKDAKLSLSGELSAPNKALIISLTGRTLILFRQNKPDESKYSLP
jgi:RNA-binding protein